MSTPETLYPATHDVFNQPLPLVNYNLFTTNRALQDALKFNAPTLDTASISAVGARITSMRSSWSGGRLSSEKPGGIRSPLSKIWV